MQYVREELFHFLEKSPYFYEKTPVVTKQRSDELIAKAEEDMTHVTYTFFDQENPNQTIAEISIPVQNPNEEIKWKFIQMNEDVTKPIYQSTNPEINKMPEWFKSLIIEVRALYERVVTMFRIFSPAQQKN